MADNAYTQAINNAVASARSMLGKNEVPNHAELMSYLHDGGQDLDPHKVAWCAAFVSASLQKAGLPVPTQVVKDSAFGPGAYAPNYLTYGNSVDPKGIQAGDILVSNDGHHVGFAEGPIRNGANGPEVQLLAGNEKDPSGQYAPGSYTSPTGAVANRAQVGMVGERWVPLSQYSARRLEPAGAPEGPTSTSASAAPSQTQGTTLNSSVIDTLSRNISGIESGGSKNPYQTLQSRTGAIGKYQVMPFNVGPWTQQALGHAETPDEFRNDAAAQEAVFRDQASSALKTMSPADFASTWFTGKPYSQATSGASDYTGTTNRNYVARATQGIDNAFAATGATPEAPGRIDPSIVAHGGTSPPIPSTPGTTLNTTPVAGVTQGQWGQLAQNLKNTGKALGLSHGDDNAKQQDQNDLPAPPAPGARNVSFLLGGPGGIGQGNVSPAYAQRMAALTQPTTWGASPPGQNPWTGYGPQAQPLVYGTSLATQLQRLGDPLWMNQSGVGGYG